MRDFEKELEDILTNDPLNLLKVKPKITSITSDERLIQSFLEIQEFYSTNNRLPKESTNIKEKQLWMRLRHIKNDHKKCIVLKEHDKHGLLNNLKEVETLDDILRIDPLGLIKDEVNDEPSIFIHKFTKKISEREKTDFVAKRRQCKDFNNFESMFKEIHKELSVKQRKLIRFNEKQLVPGSFFVHKGTLLYLESTTDLTKDKHEKFDGRTRVIFENGTESNMKFRSLGKILLDNGKAVSANINKEISILTEKDNATGYIYILKSLSDDPQIRALENLYKIGYTSHTVEERLKKSKSDPTYLMAEVEPIAEFKTFNLNPQKLEDLIHTFFYRVKLDIKIKDDSGNIISPQEWYVVPLDIIKKVIELIISGEIINYQYDHLNQCLVKKLKKSKNN